MNLLLYGLCIFSLANASIFNRIAAAPPELIGFWRLLVAGLIMTSIVVAKRKPFPSDSKAIQFSLLSGVILFVHLWSYSYAVQNTSIANAMIIFSTNPLFTAMGAHFFFKDRLAPKVAGAYLLAFIGLYLLIGENLTLNAEGMLGNISALVTALMYSGYILSGKAARKTLTNAQYTMIIYLVAAVFFLLTCLGLSRDLIHLNSNTWFGILGLVLVSTLLGHALFTYLLKHLNVNWMSCGKLAEPVVGAIMAYFVFSQDITGRALLAFVFTSLAMMVLYLPIEKLWRK